MYWSIAPGKRANRTMGRRSSKKIPKLGDPELRAPRKTVLLLGGTSETAPLAEALADEGLSVLVSTATDVPLDVGRHPSIRRRSGPLDEASLTRLLQAEHVRAVVDATHPYAAIIGGLSREVCARMELPYFRWLRPAALKEKNGTLFAADHAEAAARAFSYGTPVLLTIGSRNLELYVRESRRTGLPVVVRVLDHPDSLSACKNLGLPSEAVLTGKGPFSVEDNRAVIRRFQIGVLVTKDSGKAGGAPEKLEAARLEKCRVLVVRRPEPTGSCFNKVEFLLSALKDVLTPPSKNLPH